MINRMKTTDDDYLKQILNMADSVSLKSSFTSDVMNAVYAKSYSRIIKPVFSLWHWIITVLLVVILTAAAILLTEGSNFLNFPVLSFHQFDLSIAAYLTSAGYYFTGILILGITGSVFLFLLFDNWLQKKFKY